MQGSAIGSANRAFYSVIGQTPGTELTWLGAWAYPRVFGSTHAENAYFVDGVDTTNPYAGEWGFTINFDAIQEIELPDGWLRGRVRPCHRRHHRRGHQIRRQSVFGHARRALPGQFLPGVRRALRCRRARFASTRTSPPPWVGRCCATRSGSSRRGRVSSTTTRRSARRRPPAPWTRTIMAKLTWAINPAWRVSGKYTGYPWHTDNFNASQFVSAEATGLNGAEVDAYSGELSGVLSDSLLLTLSAGKTAWGWYQYPMSGDLETIAHYNWDTNMETGNYSYQHYLEEWREDLSADLTWFVDGPGGSHEIKGGVHYSRPGNESASCYTGSTSTEPCAQGDSGFLFHDIEDIEYGGTIPYLDERMAGCRDRLIHGDRPHRLRAGRVARDPRSDPQDRSPIRRGGVQGQRRHAGGRHGQATAADRRRLGPHRRCEERAARELGQIPPSQRIGPAGVREHASVAVVLLVLVHDDHGELHRPKSARLSPRTWGGTTGPTRRAGIRTDGFSHPGSGTTPSRA